MTKELKELIDEAYRAIYDLEHYNGGDNGRVAMSSVNKIKYYLEELFSQNVCIPKGENRHPYADVLHGWIEGIPSEYKDPSETLWHDMKFPKHEYRTKPNEPVYEWQWELFYDGQISISTFMTEAEVVEAYGRNHERIKREETKRGRKQ